MIKILNLKWKISLPTRGFMKKNNNNFGNKIIGNYGNIMTTTINSQWENFFNN